MGMHRAARENPRRIQELERRVQQLALLQDAVRKVNSLDLEQLLHEIVVDVAEAFGCSRTAVLLKNNAGEVEVIATNGFATVRRGYRFKIGTEGMVGHVADTGKMLYAPDVRLNPFYVNAEASTLSEVDIPLTIQGRVIGVLDVQSPILNGFAPDQIELLSALADYIATALENARLFRSERLQKERALREQDEARQIQAALLPGTPPLIPGYSVEGVCLQVRAVGGDWYDYVALDDKTWGIVLGDVCGKGMAAALLMSATRCVLRRLLRADLEPAHVLESLNRSLREDFPPGRFVTLIYSILDTKRHTITFANAGHLPPLLLPDEHTTVSLETEEGLPLGIAEGRYSQRTIELVPSAAMLFYTDGIVEATNQAGEEYGIERLATLLRQAGTTAEEVSNAVRSYCGDTSITDDATVVQIRRAA